MRKLIYIFIMLLAINHNGFATFCSPATGDNCSNLDTSTPTGGMGLSISNCNGGCSTTFGGSAGLTCNGNNTSKMYFVALTNPYACGQLSVDINSITGDGTSANAFIFSGNCSSYLYDYAGCVTAGDNFTSGALAAGETVYLAMGGEASVSPCITIDADVAFVNLGSPPANDDCGSPSALTNGNGIDAGGGIADAQATTTECATETCNQTLCSDGPTSDCFIYSDPPGCGLGNMSGGAVRCWGSIENSVFYTLTPSTTDTYYIHLLNQACTTNGLQFMITDVLDCSDAEATANGMLTDVGGNPACYNQNTTADIYLEVDLVAGTTYYIIVDGFAGAQCDFDLITGTVLLLDVNWGQAYAEKISDKKAQLTWEVKEEKDNGEFVIYAARNVIDVDEEDKWNLNYKEIGRVSSKSERGTKKYSFTDNNFETGNNYYYVAKLDPQGRLKTRSMSFILYNIPTFEDIKLFSNPVSDELKFQWYQNKSGSVNFRIISVSGKTVYSNTETFGVGTQQIEKNVDELQNGIYFITLTDENGNEMNERIIIKK